MIPEELIGLLADVVAGGIVVAGDEDGPAVALDAGAADARRFAPHHLRVMPAHLTGRTGISIVVVELALADPALHRLSPRPLLSAPPEEVLAVGSVGVYKGAVCSPQIGVALGVRRHGSVPLDRGNSFPSPGNVVGVQVILRGVLRLNRCPVS